MFLCTECGVSVEQKRNLQEHMLMHDKVEYKCEVCQEVKIGAKNLRNHKRIHQNSECDYCHKSIIKSHKNRHQLTCREKRVNYKCEICKYACGVKSDLNNKKKSFKTTEKN